MKTITQRSDFLSFSRKDTVYLSQYLVIQVRENRRAYVRLGITVSKRYGRAVERNQFRRRVKEAFRQSDLKDLGGIDFHVRAIHRLPISYEEIKASLQHVSQSFTQK